MLFHPLFVVINGILGTINGYLAAINFQTVEAGPLSLPWPFPWLPYEPVLGAIAASVFVTVGFITLKILRWVYGLVPFAQ